MVKVKVYTCFYIETFKSRLIEDIRTGEHYVVAAPKTVTTVHAGVGARGQPLQAF